MRRTPRAGRVTTFDFDLEGPLEGDTAVGRAYVSEFGRFRDGSSQMMYAIYHDRYRRTSEGWRFAERVYEIRRTAG
ncbi:MAG TPA: nuclear transport factor 2 family protein [Candidatus Acidoferrales bacterium]|nr:nuclear transport factor 2 family protein [Candidatus Acidoferrales bacterium]